jgi:riboflavin transporter FmnP
MKKKIRQLGIAMALAFVLVGFAAAFQTAAVADPATPAAPTIGWTEIAAILATGLFGIPVKGIAQIIKEAMRKILNIPEAHWVGWVASLIAVVPSAFLYLKPLGQMSLTNLIVASGIGWLVANGLYKENAAVQTNALTKALGDLKILPK